MRSLVRKLRSGRGLHTYTICTVVFMVLVILWGAFVRISGSGNGCGDHWPLCNNEIFPQHPTLKTIIEFAHRMQSGALTTLVLVLIVWIFFAFPKHHRARRSAVWTGVLVLTEAVLGAVLVLGHFTERDTRNLRVFVQSIHFTNTMLLLAALTLTAWWINHPSPATEPGATNLKGDRSLAVATVLLTILTGATGAVAALADTLFPSPTLRAGFIDDFAANAPLLVRMRWIHPAASILAFVCIALLCWRVRNRIAAFVASLLGIQFVLGIADVLLLAPQWMQILHLLGADVFWIALVILASESLPSRSAA